MSRKKKKSKPVQMPKQNGKHTLLFTLNNELIRLLDKRAAREAQPIQVRCKTGAHGGTDKENNKRDRKRSKQEDRGYQNEYNNKDKSKSRQFNDDGSFLFWAILINIVYCKCENLPARGQPFSDGYVRRWPVLLPY